MLNYRQFEAGPDPFGRRYNVLFKWLQTAIAIRHSDTVDVKFILDGGDGAREKTIALPHADLLKVSSELQRPLDDPWCARLAAMHLLMQVSTGEDLEKDIVTVGPPQLRAHAGALMRDEHAAVQAR
jgi:hypothetical protein